LSWLVVGSLEESSALEEDEGTEAELDEGEGTEAELDEDEGTEAELDEGEGADACGSCVTRPPAEWVFKDESVDDNVNENENDDGRAFDRLAAEM
jgi:hypothetical protein